MRCAEQGGQSKGEQSGAGRVGEQMLVRAERGVQNGQNGVGIFVKQEAQRSARRT